MTFKTKFRFGQLIFIIILFFSFANSSFAQTIVTENISTNTTWSLTGSPYIIENSITVNYNTTLNIEPGVVVKFNNQDSTSRLFLKVQGKVNAMGTELAPIYFTSFYDDAVDGWVDDEEICDPDGENCEILDTGEPLDLDWDGLIFESSTENQFSNVFIKYAFTSIDLASSAFSKFENIIIDNCNSGLVVYNDSFLNAKNLKIQNGYRAPIFLYNESHFYFDGFTIENILLPESRIFGQAHFIGKNLKFINSESLADGKIFYLTGLASFILENALFDNCNYAPCIAVTKTSSQPQTEISIKDSIFYGPGLAVSLVFWENKPIFHVNNSAFLDFENYYAVFNYSPFLFDFTNNFWGHASGPYHATLNQAGMGGKIYGNINFSPWLSAMPIPEPPDEFYARIQNSDNGFYLFDSPSLNANIIKILPNDFVLHVLTRKNADGAKIIAEGFEWVRVADPTDGTEHFAIYKNLMANTFYLPFQADLQNVFLDQSSIAIDALADRQRHIVEAVGHYYENTSNKKSLYSSSDSSALFDIAKLKLNSFPKEIFLAMIAQESGGVFKYNNEIVSFDYGHGITQVTMQAKKDFKKNKEDNRGITSMVRNLKCRNAIFDLFGNPIDGLEEYKDCYLNAKPNAYDFYQHIDTNPKYKNYSNTYQSIYANIKDGFSVLASKFGKIYQKDCIQSVFIGGLEFTCNDLKIVKAVWGYNGATFNPRVNYMRDVAEKLENLSFHFPEVTYNDIGNYINKLKIANDNRREISRHSPVYLEIIDDFGNILRTKPGEELNSINTAEFDEATERAVIFFPNGNYKYRVVGDGTGPDYGFDILDIKNGVEKIFLHAVDIPIANGEVHTYEVNEAKVGTGALDAITLSIDREGDGVVDRVLKTSTNMNTLTPYDFVFKSPLKDGEKYKLSGTLPVKIEVFAKKPGNIPMQYPRLSAYRVSDNLQAKINPNLMTEDDCYKNTICNPENHNRYILKIPKNTFSVGEWRLEVGLDDTVIHSIIINMIK